MLTVLLQSSVLLILGQLLLGAVGYVVPAGFAWLGLPLGVLLFWLIVRIARVVRGEMEEAAKKQQDVVPWQMAIWAVLLWQWPSIVLLPSGTFAPAWMGRIWNGVMLPVQGTAGLLGATADALAPWLWVAVVVEALAFVLIVGRPLTAARPAAVASAERNVAATGEWAAARRHKDAISTRRKKG